MKGAPERLLVLPELVVTWSPSLRRTAGDSPEIRGELGGDWAPGGGSEAGVGRSREGMAGPDRAGESQAKLLPRFTPWCRFPAAKGSTGTGSGGERAALPERQLTEPELSQLQALLQPGAGPEQCHSPREALAAGRAPRAAGGRGCSCSTAPSLAREWKRPGQVPSQGAAATPGLTGCRTVPFGATAGSARCWAAPAGRAWGGAQAA